MLFLGIGPERPDALGSLGGPERVPRRPKALQGPQEGSRKGSGPGKGLGGRRRAKEGAVCDCDLEKGSKEENRIEWGPQVGPIRGPG
jgi:hypothetical protein